MPIPGRHASGGVAGRARAAPRARPPAAPPRRPLADRSGGTARPRPTSGADRSGSTAASSAPASRRRRPRRRRHRRRRLVRRVSGGIEQRLAAFAAKGPEYEAIAKLSREIIEQVVWEVVPELAEAIIREQVEKRGRV